MKTSIISILLMLISIATFAQQKVNAHNHSEYVTVKMQTVNELNETVSEQKQIINDLNQTVNELQELITKSPAYKTIPCSMSDAVPNPTKNKSELEYYVDKSADNAYITLYDMNQKKLREYPLNIGDKNYLLINTNNFNPGMYVYVLTVNGIKMDSKKLIVE